MSEQSPGTENPTVEQPTPTVITVGVDGPNMLVGTIEIRNAAGELIKTAKRVALCRCGASESKPFCDGSHKRIGFSDPGPSLPAA